MKLNRSNFCAALVLAATLTFGLPASGTFPDPPADYTHIAVGVGGWQKPESWNTGEVPGDGAIIHIPENRNIAVTRQQAARYRFIRVDGILRMVIRKDTRLLVETLYVGPHGQLLIGLPGNRLHADKTAEIVFTSSGPFDLSWDPGQRSRGLISDGAVRIYGAIKTPFVTMTRDALAGDTSLTVDVDLDATGANWQAGDEIVLTGTFFRQYQSSRDERRTIQSVNGSQILLDDPLDFDHVRASSTFALHVANLTRNLILRSEVATDCPPEPSQPSRCSDRGHVMLRNGDVDIRHAAFVHLGRTDKTQPLDDTVVEVDENGEFTGLVSQPAAADIENPRGRYSVHFHLNGAEPGASTPPSQVHDSVVVGTPGWGFVNHSSHVDFRRNVCYNFAGSAFVTEAGDELGNFIENLAIRGTGNGEYRQSKIVSQNEERPQPLSDFGFLGDGFWFQGPAIRVRDNVANGCQGAGMVWFTTGAPDITDIDPQDSRNNYVGFPDALLEPTYEHFPDFAAFEGRHWDHAPDELVVSDLPILECDGFEAYGNFIGFRFRFNNLDNNAWYTDGPFDYDEDILPIPGSSDNSEAVRMRETVSNLVLWNNEQAFRSRYSSKTDFENVTAVNRLIYSDNGRNPGGELSFQVSDTTLSEITIDGYTIAGFIDNGGGQVPSELTFLTPENYSNFAMFDTCKPCLKKNACSNVTSVWATALGPTSAQLNWDTVPHPDQEQEHGRYLIRYWVSGQDHVEFATVDSGSTETLDLTGLIPGTEYRFQVLAGCDTLPSKRWSDIGEVTTQP